jgi:PPM family protein phosphatase
MPSDNYKEILHYDINEHLSQIEVIGDYKIGIFISKNKFSNDINEDVLFMSYDNNGLILGVSDGAGGHPKGHEASLLTGKGIIESFEELSSNLINPISIIEKINTSVLDMKIGARCTLSLVTIMDDYFRCYSIGDSEIIYWNSIGGEIFSNIPHSTIGYRIEAGSVLQEESLDDPERHIVTNLIGDETVRIDSTSKISLKKGHTILVGTDGLFDNISHEKLKEIAASGLFETSFEELVESCVTQDESVWRKDDDIAFIMLRKIKS